VSGTPDSLATAAMALEEGTPMTSARLPSRSFFPTAWTIRVEVVPLPSPSTMPDLTKLAPYSAAACFGFMWSAPSPKCC
jgi:hypothetical protein